MKPDGSIIVSHDSVWVSPMSTTPSTPTVAPQVLCPDLLRYEQIGEADNLRGRVVRAFFWLMRWWPT